MTLLLISAITAAASPASSHHGLSAVVTLVVLLVVTGLVLWIADKLGRKDSADTEGNTGNAIAQSGTADTGCDEACCNSQSVCPSHMLLEGETGTKCEITYYDDEELDAYRGKGSSGYTPDEIDRFRDVLYTLLPADLMGWQRSLKRRGITMPDAIHDEFIMLYNEHSGTAQQ